MAIAGSERGYISGFSDGTFRGEEKVTYGQLYKMLVTAQKMEISQKNMEYSSSHWARPYAETLLNNGSKEIRRVNLDEEVPRKVAIKALLEAFGVKFAFNSMAYKNQPFRDMPLADSCNYDGYIYAAHYFGIVKGFSDNLVKPEETLTRAEIITLIERAFNVKDWTVPEPERIENININFLVDDSKKYYNRIMTTLDKFPINLIKDFSENGGQIIITNERPVDIFGEFSDDVTGNYSPINNEITIYANSSAFSSVLGFEDTLEHEIGHYLYFNILSDDDKNKIKEIFEEGMEPENLSIILDDKYCTTSSEEFFAELIDYVLSSPNTVDNNKIVNSLMIVKKYITINNPWSKDQWVCSSSFF